MVDFEIKTKNESNFLVSNNRIFLPSKSIDVFPCSRRGQSNIENSAAYYDPEARLNTERTNRIGTAINGFKSSFVVNDTFIDGDTLVFVLAGYRVEVKNFIPNIIDELLELEDNDILCAHLSLHTGISLLVKDYYTEILYRQSDRPENKNYLDVHYSKDSVKDDFFVGVSFTKNIETIDTLTGDKLVSYNLPIFKKDNGILELVQTSLLPKVEHDTTVDSIKISGDFTIKHSDETSFKVVKNGSTTETTINTDELKVTGSTMIKGATTVDNNVDADNLTIHDNGKVDTPTLNTNTITSSSNDGLKINPSTTLNNTLMVYGETTLKDSLFVDKGIKVTEGLEVATGNLWITKGKVSAAKGNVLIGDSDTEVDLKVTTSADINTLDVGTLKAGNISAEGTITADTQVSTPEVKVNIIKSDSDNGLTIEPATTLSNTLTVNGETSLQKLTATEVVAEKLSQNGKAVPTIGLNPLGNEIYQLQITLDASKN